jgi:DnaJ like chaperone protein
VSWWGKLLGGAFGFVLGGPLGALLGAVLGHRLDSEFHTGAAADASFGVGGQERTQLAFFTATFSVMGYIAKADGRVSDDEIRMAREVMRQMALDAEMQKVAIQLFSQGKQPHFDVDDVLAQFKRECSGRRSLLRMFLTIQMSAAYADGHLHSRERAALWHLFTRLGFSRTEFDQIQAQAAAGMGAGETRGGRPAAPSAASTVAQAREILGVKKNTPQSEVKKAYRRLMNQHHPDKLVSKGLPAEMMKVATEKTRQIKEAYETIKQDRGWR